MNRSLDAVSEALGSAPAVPTTEISRSAGTSTWRVDLVDGRRVAVQRFHGRGARVRTIDAARAVPAMAAAGIPVPAVASVVEVHGAAWLVTTWIEGASGRTWLDTAERADRLALGMGGAAALLATVDPGVIEGDSAWTSADRLAIAVRIWRAAVGIPVESELAAALDRASEAIRATFEGAPAVFAHGDLAPVNALVGPDGTIRSLVDFGGLRRAVPWLDVAWWGWILRFHHPAVWRSTWPAFRDAAGAPPAAVPDDAIHALQVVECLSRAAALPAGPLRDAWLIRLATTAAWSRS